MSAITLFTGLRIALEHYLSEIRPDFYRDDLSNVKEENVSAICSSEMQRFVHLSRVNKEFKSMIHGILDDFARKLFEYRNKTYQEQGMPNLVITFQPHQHVFFVFWERVKEANFYLCIRLVAKNMMEELDRKKAPSSELKPLLRLNTINKKFNELVNRIFDDFAIVGIKLINQDFERMGIDGITCDPTKVRPLIALLKAVEFFKDLNKQTLATNPSEEKAIQIDRKDLVSFEKYVAFLRTVNTGPLFKSAFQKLETEINRMDGKPSKHLQDVINEYMGLCLDSNVAIPMDEINALLGNDNKSPQQRVEEYLETCDKTGQEISSEYIEMLMNGL